MKKEITISTLEFARILCIAKDLDSFAENTNDDQFKKIIVAYASLTFYEILKEKLSITDEDITTFVELLKQEQPVMFEKFKQRLLDNAKKDFIERGFTNQN